MTTTIWKFNLSETTTTFDLPEESQVLSVGAQGDFICLWVLVDTEAPKTKRTFKFYGTGWNIEEHKDALFYIGTVQMPYTGFVFHVFEEEDFGLDSSTNNIPDLEVEITRMKDYADKTDSEYREILRKLVKRGV